MSIRNKYRAGEWLAACDECGDVCYASALRKRWDNLMVDAKCYEPRHPQEFVRGVPDNQGVPWTRNPPNRFLNEQYRADSEAVNGNMVNSTMLG